MPYTVWLFMLMFLIGKANWHVQMWLTLSLFSAITKLGIMVYFWWKSRLMVIRPNRILMGIPHYILMNWLNVLIILIKVWLKKSTREILIGKIWRWPMLPPSKVQGEFKDNAKHQTMQVRIGRNDVSQWNERVFCYKFLELPMLNDLINLPC